MLQVNCLMKDFLVPITVINQRLLVPWITAQIVTLIGSVTRLFVIGLNFKTYFRKSFPAIPCRGGNVWNLINSNNYNILNKSQRSILAKMEPSEGMVHFSLWKKSNRSCQCSVDWPLFSQKILVMPFRIWKEGCSCDVTFLPNKYSQGETFFLD